MGKSPGLIISSRVDKATYSDLTYLNQPGPALPSGSGIGTGILNQCDEPIQVAANSFGGVDHPVGVPNWLLTGPQPGKDAPIGVGESVRADTGGPILQSPTDHLEGSGEQNYMSRRSPAAGQVKSLDIAPWLMGK